jgi:NADH dehydrogenase
VDHEGALVAKAQVRMLTEGVTDAAPPAASVPDYLRPRRRFTTEQIRQSLPEPGAFGWKGLRVSG